MDLRGKIAVVTGAAQGIGHAIAVGLAEVGADVIIADINGDRASKEANELLAKGMAVRSFALDVTKKEQWAGLADELPDGLDVLVNNAGLYSPLTREPFERQSDEEFHWVMEVNTFSIFIGCKAMVPLIRKRGGGSIVNITSDGVYRVPVNLLPYTTSKFAVTGMTHVLSRELGGDNIRVNNVAPGFTLSEGVLSSSPEEPKQVSIIERMTRAAMSDARSLKRDQYPKDVAGTVRFLCSPDAAFITGQTIVVNGGIICH